MVKRISIIFAVLVLIIGLSLLLYPTVSDYINRVNSRRAIFNYLAAVETLSDDEYEQILAEAREYNQKLSESPLSISSLTDEQLAEYEQVLDITGTGIMGYIVIGKANINLPIYHGSSEAVLQVGVGHLEGSSLPVGGTSVHSMLSGHRGLPSAKLFTDLDKLAVGDTFTIHVLNEFFSYEVENIETVLPEEVDSLKIEKGRDQCTLITCTPYGVNSHRLLIHGKRIILPIDEEKMAIQSGARYIDTLYVLLAVEIPVLIITVIVSVSRIRRQSHKTNH